MKFATWIQEHSDISFEIDSSVFENKPMTEEEDEKSKEAAKEYWDYRKEYGGSNAFAEGYMKASKESDEAKRAEAEAARAAEGESGVAKVGDGGEGGGDSTNNDDNISGGEGAKTTTNISDNAVETNDNEIDPDADSSVFDGILSDNESGEFLDDPYLKEIIKDEF